MNDIAAIAAFLTVTFGGMIATAATIAYLYGSFKRVEINGRVFSLPPSRLATAMISLAMFYPAIGVLLATVMEGKSLLDYGLKSLGSPIYLALALLYPLAVVAFSVLTAYLVDPGLVKLGSIEGLLKASLIIPPQGRKIPPKLLKFLIFAQFAVAPLFNTIFALGEEVGWRGFLLEKLSSYMSPICAALAVGVIWGLWHAPLVLLGFNYPHHPDCKGVLTFTLVCTLMSVWFSWLTLKTGSVVPAALAHGAYNAYAGLALYIVNVEDELYGAPFGTLSLPTYILLAVIAAFMTITM